MLTIIALFPLLIPCPSPPQCVPTDLEPAYTLLRDLTYESGWTDRELSIFCALIDTESSWIPTAHNTSVVDVRGLGQLTSWWLKSPALSEFRIDPDYKQRNLFSAEDNIKTMIELMRYYYALYPDDWHSILTAYSSGGSSGKSRYSKLILNKAGQPEYQPQIEWLIWTGDFQYVY